MLEIRKKGNIKTIPKFIGRLASGVFVAMSLITNLQAQQGIQIPAKEVPESGTFWSLQLPDSAPLPFNPFPDVPVYFLGDDTFQFDDRSVNYDEVQMEAAFNAALAAPLDGMLENLATMAWNFTSNDLWLEVAGDSLAVSNKFDVILHNPTTGVGQLYAILTKTDLTYSNWTAELLVTGNVLNATSAQLTRNDRTNLFVWARSCTSTNLTIDSSPTPEQLVQMLVGTSVTISNASFTGTNVARGTFTNGICVGLPIDSGVILSSGNITNALGPNNDDGSTAIYTGSILGTPGDEDLSDVVAGGPTHDAAILEFEIVSSNSFVLQFQYIFASEEYPEFIARYNDPMAILVSTNFDGTNWINKSNIALVPGTNQPVSVSTINGGYPLANIPPSNPQYYVDNGDPNNTTNAPVANIQYDGMTVMLTAPIQISADVTYYIKIAIADYKDSVYDSAIFLKASPPSE